MVRLRLHGVHYLSSGHHAAYGRYEGLPPFAADVELGGEAPDGG